ncbi:LolA family protein, partial [Peterkaempfera griseoplana]|uniref:LolA family protein n=1 Tax=Peterkaempfera griseoplana TaxID=66896 RepID=UPI0006E36D08
IGLVPALASDAGPTLPQQSAEQLVAKVLASDVQSLSGTVQADADLGLPAGVLDGAGALGGAGGPFGGSGAAHSRAKGGAEGGGTASPQARLTELLAGSHTLQVAVDGPDRQRLGLMDKLAEYEIVHNGNQVWGWDSTTNEAVHSTLPAGHDSRTGSPDRALPFDGGSLPATPQQAARQILAQAGTTSSVTVAGTSRVAGRNAYELSVRPKQSGSTVGDVRIAVDAATGVPLRVRVNAAGGGSPVFDVHFASVSFARPGARTFDFSPPKGAKVTEQKASAAGDRTAAGRPGPASGRNTDGPVLSGTGWTTVASFKLPADHGSQGMLSLAKGLGKPVLGGTLIHSRLVNVLIGDNGTVYAGAVSAQVLEHAAGAR